MNDMIGFAGSMNTVLNGVGTSLERNSGNSSWGSNHKFYWHTAGQRGFYGNQYVNATKLTCIGNRITKVAGPMGKFLDGSQIAISAYNDYQDYQYYGYTNCYKTVHTTGDIIGSLAGGRIGILSGTWLGAKAGAGIGSFFGGGGAIPGAIVGGIIFGIGGSWGGSWIGTETVDSFYGM